jgi:5-methylcytosine-specific restriction endonuclease McrA
MNLTRAYLNFRALSIPTQWQMTKAKRAHKKKFPVCAVCGTVKDLEVHHIIPVHIDHTRACDPKNFITLCDWRNHGCHYVWGHHRNFRSKWNPYIVEFAEMVEDFCGSVSE